MIRHWSREMGEEHALVSFVTQEEARKNNFEPQINADERRSTQINHFFPIDVHLWQGMFWPFLATS
jgi:hypothetical protein